jgi:CBS domain-containing protein
MKRNVVSVKSSASIREAAKAMSLNHIGILPVVNDKRMLVGVVGLPDILSLEMPAFFNLISDLDFVGDFGAVETTRPSADEIDRSVTEIMQHAVYVNEDGGLLYAYGLMLKHNLSDLPVITEAGELVGVVSRVDIGSTILTNWEKIG